MNSHKYAIDYRLENIQSGNKQKTVPVYIGKKYCFSASKEEVRQFIVMLISHTVLSVVFYLLICLLNAPCDHIMYVFLPIMPLLFPLFYLLCTCWILIKHKEFYTRKEHDQVEGRMATSSFLGCVFSALSVIGHIAYCFKYPVTLKDLISLAAAVICYVLCLSLFLKRRILHMDESR